MDLNHHSFETADTVSPKHYEPDNFAHGWLDRFSVAIKVRAAIFGNILIFVALLTLMIGTAVYLGNKAIAQGDMASTSELMSDANTALSEARFSLNESGESGDPKLVEAALVELNRAHINYELLTVDDHAFPQTIQSANAARLAEIDAIRAMLSDLANQTEDVTAIAAAADRTANVLQSSRSEFAEVVEIVASEFAGLLEEITFFIWFVGASGAILLILALWGGRQVSRNITGMMGSVTDAMTRIAGGNTNTSIPGQSRGDELGDLARGLVVFRSASLELQEIAETDLAHHQVLVEQSNQMRSEKSDLLHKLADSFEISNGDVIAEVGGASGQLKATSNSMVELAERSTQQSLQASTAMREASNSVHSAAAATDEFTLSISEVSKQAAASASAARGASELVVAANAKMTDLSDAADEIGEIVGLIETIAQRTNLLALNASIEAARGGEAGRGFAVVASEVKELANQTSNATNSITGKIQAMQISTGTSVDDLTSIVSQMNELEQSATIIADAVNQQSNSANELARNIDSVARSTSNVESQLEQMHEASLMTGSASTQVQTSASELGQHAEVMREKAKGFLETVRRSAIELSSASVDVEPAASEQTQIAGG